MTSFVDEYFSHLICGIVLSVVSLATALDDSPYVADAMTTCDILLRRAGQSDMCTGEYLSEGAAREWSTVVKIFITSPSLKPVSLSLSRISSVLKHPNKSFLTQ